MHDIAKEFAKENWAGFAGPMHCQEVFERYAERVRAAALDEAWNAAGSQVKFSSSIPAAVMAYVQSRADAQALIRDLAQKEH